MIVMLTLFIEADDPGLPAFGSIDAKHQILIFAIAAFRPTPKNSIFTPL